MRLVKFDCIVFVFDLMCGLIYLVLFVVWTLGFAVVGGCVMVLFCLIVLWLVFFYFGLLTDCLWISLFVCDGVCIDELDVVLLLMCWLLVMFCRCV